MSVSERDQEKESIKKCPSYMSVFRHSLLQDKCVFLHGAPFPVSVFVITRQGLFVFEQCAVLSGFPLLPECLGTHCVLSGAAPLKLHRASLSVRTQADDLKQMRPK